jgi:hypothetical protein
MRQRELESTYVPLPDCVAITSCLGRTRDTRHATLTATVNGMTLACMHMRGWPGCVKLVRHATAKRIQDLIPKRLFGIMKLVRNLPPTCLPFLRFAGQVVR